VVLPDVYSLKGINMSAQGNALRNKRMFRTHEGWNPWLQYLAEATPL